MRLIGIQMTYESFLLYSHPIIQLFALSLGFLAMYQGYKRFAMKRGKKIIFPWKQHVKFGSYALILWVIGGLGFYVTHTIFGMTHITDLHAEVAWYVISLSVFGLGTGFIMNKYKKKRNWMPALHGIANILLLILVVYEAYSGMELLSAFGLV